MQSCNRDQLNTDYVGFLPEMDNNATAIPAEIHNRISSYLSKKYCLEASLASKQWFNGFMPLIWSDLRIPSDEWDSFHKRIRKTPRKYSYMVKKLFIIPVLYDIKISSIVQFTKNCSSLVQFSINNPDLGDDEVWILLKGCPLLKSLTLGVSGKFTDVGLETLARSASLQEIYFTGFDETGFSGRGLRALADRNQKLLGFGLCWAETNKRFTMNVDNEDFAGCLSQLISKHNELRELRVDWPANFELAMETASKALSKLSCLKLGNHRSVQHIIQLLSNNELTCLCLNEVHLGGSISVLKNAKLQVLELNGVCTLEELSPVLATLHDLESIVYYPTSRYAQINQTGNLVVPNHSKLAKVVLPINDNETLFSFCSNNLKHLAIDGRSVDNHGIVIMSTKVKLEFLDLGHSEIGFSGINALVQYMGSTLEYLILPTTGVSNQDVHNLLCGLKRLKMLKNIPGSVRFEELMDGVMKCQLLEEISINGPILPSLTRIQIEKVKQSSKRLKRVELHQYIY